MLRADVIEQLVWDDCAEFICNPGKALDDAARQLRERLSKVANLGAEEQRLIKDLVSEDNERQAILTLLRKQRITLADAEQQLAAINAEAAELSESLDNPRAQHELASAAEAQYAETSAMLAQLRDRLDEVERTNDWDTEREVVEELVSSTGVTTEPARPYQGNGYGLRLASRFSPIRVVPAGRVWRSAPPGSQPEVAIVVSPSRALAVS
jgi:site-specific DNA recombinase